MSGYICPVCWSTRNDCPCTKEDRVEKCKSTEFAADAEIPEDMTAAVSQFFFQFHEKQIEFLFFRETGGKKNH